MCRRVRHQEVDHLLVVHILHIPRVLQPDLQVRIIQDSLGISTQDRDLVPVPLPISIPPIQQDQVSAKCKNRPLFIFKTSFCVTVKIHLFKVCLYACHMTVFYIIKNATYLLYKKLDYYDLYYDSIDCGSPRVV